MRIEYGIAFDHRTLELPPVVTIRWACKRCQANGIGETHTSDIHESMSPAADIAEQIATDHAQASPDCKANILITLAAFNIKDV